MILFPQHPRNSRQYTRICMHNIADKQAHRLTLTNYERCTEKFLKIANNGVRKVMWSEFDDKNV